jgi:hypothetical protein
MTVTFLGQITRMRFAMFQMWKQFHIRAQFYR